MNASQPQNPRNGQFASSKSGLNLLLNLSLDLFGIRGQDGYFQQLNSAWEKVLGWSESELIHTPWIEWVHPDDVEVCLKAEARCDQEDIVEYENRYRHKDGSYRWLSWKVSKGDDGLFYAVGKDITATKQSQEVLWQRLEFEKLITNLSTKFINLCSEEIDSEINHTLQLIAEYVGCDRSYVVLFSHSEAGAPTQAINYSERYIAYEWYAEALEPLMAQWQRFSTEPYAWWMAKLRSFETMQMACIADLPPEANAERQVLQSVGVKSMIAVPMVQGKTLIGYIGFLAVKEEKTWPDDLVALLRIVSDIFANAWNRKQAELKLRESERRFRAVFNQTFQLSSLLTLDGSVLEDNQTAMDVCQLERSAVIGHPFWELPCWTISPETQERLKKAIALAATGNVVRYEADILAPDNSVITIDFSLKPLKDETGKVELLIAEGRDLTERKRIEENLQRTVNELTEWQNRYEAAGQINGLLLYEWDSQTEEVIWGSNVEQVFGYSEEELSGNVKQWMELIHPDDVEEFCQTLERAIATKEPLHLEYRMRQKDGSYITIEDNGKFYPDSNGTLNRMIGFLANITERKRTEEALRESEQRWQLALQGNNDGIWDWNIKTNETFYLARWKEMLGYQEHELSNHLDEWRTRVHPDDQDRVMQAVEEYLERQTPLYIAEYRMRCKDGSYKWILDRGQAVWDKTGVPVRMVGSHTDISSRKQAEAALQQLLSELETKVEERTAQLKQANEQLVKEMAERQRTQETLCQREEQFRRVFDEAPIGMALANGDGRLFRVNRALLNMLGYSESELTALSFRDISHPEDLEQELPYMEQVRNGEIDNFQLEKRYLKKNQEILWGNLTSVVMRDQAGNILYSLGMVEDISTRKQALEALSKSEELFRRVFDESPIGMGLTSQDKCFFRVNRALQDMLGYSESELQSLSCEDITHPEDWQCKLPYLQQLEKGEIESITVEERYLKKNQEIVWGNLTSMVMRDQAGEILYGLGMVEDVTERKQALEALQQSEARYRAIVEDQTELICRFKPNGTLTFVNNAYCRYFSKECSELIGHSFMPVIPEEDQELINKSFATLSQDQPIVTYEHRVILPSGETRWQQWTDRAMFDAKSNLIEFQRVGRDITPLKQAEAEIRNALEKERELNELRSGFVSIVSHEFRTPLTTIQSSAQLIERYGNRLPDEKKLIHLTRIQSAVIRMTQLLDDVLTIGKAEAGKLQFEPSLMDVAAFCGDLVESMQIVARPTHTINFVVQGDANNARMDEKLLGHIITNLLSNAIKYSPTGGTIQFDLICSDSSMIFRVQDSGIGIPRKDLETLFESFQRASNVGAIPGTGLGLAIVKRCVDLHEGEITVDSEIGVGTTFTVTLPLI